MKFLKNIKPFWFVICAFYLLFIFLFSYLYPLGIDEYYSLGMGLGEALQRGFVTFTTHSPKIGGLLALIVLYFGKWFFALVNPFMQCAVVLGIFYFVYLRLPDFKDYKDLPASVLIMLLSVFAVAVPSNTLFWIGGATAYSWAFLFFLFFLCAARAWYEGKPFFKDNWLNSFLIILPALCLGLSNENNAPMALCLFAAFLLWCFYKKIKMPKWFYFALAGLVCGLVLMFLSPALKQRVQDTATGLMDKPLLTKLFWHIGHFHVFIKANLLVFVFGAMGLFICGIDWDKTPFKNKKFILGALSLSVSFGVFFVLFIAPDVGGRTYYSATVSAIIAFLFLLDYIEEAYGFYPVKYCALAMMVYAAVALPLFALPYFNLHAQEVNRQKLLGTARAQGKTAYLPFYLVIRPGVQNYEILFYDVMHATPRELALYLGGPAAPLTQIHWQLMPPSNSVLI